MQLPPDDAPDWCQKIQGYGTSAPVCTFLAAQISVFQRQPEWWKLHSYSRGGANDTCAAAPASATDAGNRLQLISTMDLLAAEAGERHIRQGNGTQANKDSVKSRDLTDYLPLWCVGRKPRG